jgi:hypothetical protein
MFFARCDEFYPHRFHGATFDAFAPAGHRKTPPSLPIVFPSRVAINHRALNESTLFNL